MGNYPRSSRVRKHATTLRHNWSRRIRYPSHASWFSDEAQVEVSNGDWIVVALYRVWPKSRLRPTEYDMSPLGRRRLFPFLRLSPFLISISFLRAAASSAITSTFHSLTLTSIQLSLRSGSEYKTFRVKIENGCLWEYIDAVYNSTPSATANGCWKLGLETTICFCNQVPCFFFLQHAFLLRW